MTTIIVTTLTVFVYGVLIEYVLHRWVMHKPYLGRLWYYTEHAVEHHGKGRNDINVSLSPITVSLIASPVMLLYFIYGYGVFVVVVALSFLYAGLWTVLHNSFHDVKYTWVHKCFPFYSTLEKHHILHHKNPNTNFGTIFFFSDYLFGTKHA